MKKKVTVSNVLLVVLAAAIITQPMLASATHQPANKVVADGDAIVEIQATTTPMTLATSTFKTSGPTDLMISFSLECSILTQVNAEGGPEVTTTSGEANGRIRVWLEFDGKEVAINQTSDTPQPSDPPEIGKDIDKVTFCNNHQKFTVTDTEDGMDGTDTYDLYLKTKAANAFNWIVMNTGGWSTSNIHTLKVQAAFDEPTPATDGSTASGFVGNRMLIVEPTKMSNHAST